PDPSFLPYTPLFRSCGPVRASGSPSVDTDAHFEPAFERQGHGREAARARADVVEVVGVCFDYIRTSPGGFTTMSLPFEGGLQMKIVRTHLQTPSTHQ